MRAIELRIDEIYVPGDRRKELDHARVEEVAEDILSEEEQRPIQVRKGKDRYVLIKGVHRLEARRSLGEETIQAYLVSARRA